MVLIVYPWAKCAQYSCCQMRLWLTYVRRSKLTTFIGYVYVSEVITIDCLFKARVLIRKISYLDLYCSSFLQNECVEVVKDLFGIIADMYFHGWKIGKKSCEKISLRCWCTTVWLTFSIRFHSTGCVDSVTEETVSWHLYPNNASTTRTWKGKQSNHTRTKPVNVIFLGE